MYALRQQGQRLRRLGQTDELPHIVPAGQVQAARQLSVDRMLHNDVQYGASVVHYDLQLFFHIRPLVAAGHLPPQPLPASLDHIAPGGCVNSGAAGPQQGDVAHDQLAAHAEPSRQRRSADRTGSLGQDIQYSVPALLGSHGPSSSFTVFLQYTPFLRSRQDTSTRCSGLDGIVWLSPLRKTHTNPQGGTP